MHNSRQIDPSWWASDDLAIVEKIEEYLAEIESLRSVPPFGVELPMYAELVDKNVRIFVFASEASERIIYSVDRGKEIFEKTVPRGTVGALCESLPKVV